MISKRKKQALYNMNSAFSGKHERSEVSNEHQVKQLHAKIGELNLLRDKVISKANEVWCTDITYIPMNRGFMYLVAIMDWSSRKVLSWRLSNTLDTSFCLDALEEGIYLYGKPFRNFL